MFTLLKCSRRCYVIRLLEFHLNTTYCSRSWVCSYQSQAWRLCACKAPGKTRGDSFILQLSRWRQGRRLFKLHDGLKNVLLENMTTKLETLGTKEYFRACRHVFHGRYFIYGHNYVPTTYKTLYSVPSYIAAAADQSWRLCYVTQASHGFGKWRYQSDHFYGKYSVVIL